MKSNKQQKKIQHKKNRRKKQFLLPLRLFSLLTIVGLACFLISLFNLNILPLYLLVPVSTILIALFLVLMIFGNFKARRPITRFLSLILIMVICASSFLGRYYIEKTYSMFEQVTNLTNKTTHTISVIVNQDSKVQDIHDIDGGKVSICLDYLEDGYTTVRSEGDTRALNDIKNQGISVEVEEYNNYIDAIHALQDGEVDAFILDEAYRGIVHEIEEFTLFNNQTRTIYKTVYYTDRKNVEDTSLNAVNVTTQPFTVLISGNDSYGSLNEVSRSDVNMLVTINPKTSTILMTSIPRDYYIPFVCGADSGNCVDGMKDKLTHTGLYGLETTEKSLEELFGITINYHVRVNFSSLVNLVDALGGIDVYVDKGLEVETFYVNSTPGVKAGKNHLDGERALAFARERYAYVDGDVQRVKNQQQVLTQIVKKVASPSMIVNFGKFMDALGGAFETNMSSDDMLSLIRYEFTFYPKWVFESYAVLGYDSNEYSPTVGDYAFAMLINDESVNIAKNKIEAVNNDQSSTTVDETLTQVDPVNDAYASYDY